MEALLNDFPEPYREILYSSLIGSEALLSSCERLTGPILDDDWLGLHFYMLYNYPMFKEYIDDPQIMEFFSNLPTGYITGDRDD